MAKKHKFASLTFGAKFQKETCGDHIFVKVSPTQYVEITANSSSIILNQKDLEEKITLVRANFFV